MEIYIWRQYILPFQIFARVGLSKAKHTLIMYLIGELCAERDALGDGAQVVEDGDAGAVNEIGVAEGEGGRVQVRLVVARELHRLPLALLDL